MQIESLKVFCDLADTASFSAAAERNAITQSAVSQQIRTLETRYGVTFFERGKKNFSITPEGQVFNRAARAMLQIFCGIDEQLQQLRDVVTGPLRIATVYSIGLHELPPLIRKFRESFPEVELHVEYARSGQVYQDVIDGRADLGLVAYPKLRKGIVVDTFAKDRLVMVCAPDHPLASRRRVRLEDLAGLKLIAFEPDLPTRKALDRAFRDAGVQFSQTMEFDNIETVKRAVEVEGGISIVPERSVEREVAAGVLRAVEVTSPEIWRPLGLVKKRTRATSPAMREFITALEKWSLGRFRASSR